MLKDIPDQQFRVIYADPPWDFKNYSQKGLSRNPNKHYQTMSTEDICSIDVKPYCYDETLLFMWITGPKLPDAFKVIDAWGFTYSGIAFTWVKLNKTFKGDDSGLSPSDFFMSTGYGTRKNIELCLLAKKKIVNRQATDVRELIISPIREHSRKPDETYDRIERFVGNQGPYLELFSRTSRTGWHSWGNQKGLFD